MSRAARVVQRAWPLVGRGEELDELTRNLLGDEHLGVVVAGPPGVGKTRLAREALDVACLAGCAVQWVVATQATASIPLSVFASLLPSSELIGEDLDAFGRVAAVLHARATGRRLVFAVDDAHLLDDAAAALVLHLATTGTVRVLVTVRSGVAAPDAIVALWKEGLATRLDLQPLAAADVARLVSDVLAGQLEAATAERLWHATGGNVLFVRELVDDLVRTGRLYVEDGVWRWEGGLAPGPRLRELVSDRLGRLGARERRAVEVLAVGEPLGVVVLSELCGSTAVTALERAAVVVVEQTENRRDVRLAHPLHGEIVQATMPSTRRSDLARVLVEATATHTRRAGDTMRLALWALEAGAEVSASMLTEAAAQANVVLEYQTAERLARAALRCDGGPCASVALGQALIGQGRFADAVAVLAAPTAGASDDAEVARRAYWHAIALAHLTGDVDDGVRVLAAAEARIREVRWRDFLRADRAAKLAIAGRTSEAAALAGALVEDPAVDEVVRLRALAAVGRHWALSAESARALTATEPLFAAALRQRSLLPRAPGWVLSVAVVACIASGRLDEADALLDRAGKGGPAALEILRARVCLLRGKPETAAVRLREAAAALRHSDIEGWRPWALALLAEALAVRGDAEGAERALAEADATANPAMRSAAHDSARAAAWVPAARGELTLARTRALRAAKECESAGEHGLEMHILHDALRLGATEVVSRLVELGSQVDGAFAPVFAKHAASLACDDASALEQVSAAFEALGAVRMAVEAAAEATEAYRRNGLVARANVAATRATILQGACEQAAIPALDLADAGLARLSRREREIAALASPQRSNREIAVHLGVSVRTVEGHLYRLYTKLGTSDREQLAELLAPPHQNE